MGMSDLLEKKNKAEGLDVWSRLVYLYVVFDPNPYSDQSTSMLLLVASGRRYHVLNTAPAEL